jgi:ATP-dependent RNA circularization protein (DNA/RNA ligase family)
MKEYHKIQTIYKRDEHGKIIIGDYSKPEFKYLSKNDWLWSEKVDGTNIRVMWNEGSVKFGGKTDKAQIPSNLTNRLIELFPTEKFLSLDSTEMCLYGEGHGSGIQKGGGNYSLNQDFVLFDVKIGHWWLLRKDVEEIAEKLNISVVPIIGAGTLFEAEELVKKGFNSKWGNFLAEGLVLTPMVPLMSRNGDRVITKLKYKDFN